MSLSLFPFILYITFYFTNRALQWERFFELAPSKVSRKHRYRPVYKLFKKRKGTLGQKIFSARVVYGISWMIALFV